jgi:indolepyruvate ferredoxin oxidoreductase beta subunit
MADKTDIFITGVGGQGSLSASTFLGQAAVEAGLKVLVGEIHGMAQRGGIVESTVRIGEVYGPIISDGQADILLAFEPIEALRAMVKASERTLVVTNTHPVVPATVSMKGQKYPDTDEVLGRIRAISPHVIAFDATETARQAGNAQALNAVLLGVLAGAGVLPFGTEILRTVVLDGVPQKARDVNEKAFAMGMEMAAKAMPAPCGTQR